MRVFCFLFFALSCISCSKKTGLRTVGISDNSLFESKKYKDSVSITPINSMTYLTGDRYHYKSRIGLMMSSEYMNIYKAERLHQAKNADYMLALAATNFNITHNGDKIESIPLNNVFYIKRDYRNGIPKTDLMKRIDEQMVKVNNAMTSTMLERSIDNIGDYTIKNRLKNLDQSFYFQLGENDY